MKPITFRNKIAKSIINANEAGLHDVTITKAGANIIANSIMKFVKKASDSK